MRRIITISREFGSGGRELGKRLAESFGMAYYDREIVTALAQKRMCLHIHLATAARVKSPAPWGGKNKLGHAP